MEKWIAICFVSLLFLQAIPVMHFFAANKSKFYAYIDEDKPQEQKQKEIKKETKEYLDFTPIATETTRQARHYRQPGSCSLPAPYLESFSPPPDFTC